MASRSFFIFLLVLLFVLSLSIILFELALTRIFSIVLWYDYAFMAISIAFFGLGIGSFVIHIQKDKYNTLKKKSIIDPRLTFSSRIVQYALAYGISVPVFIFLIGYIPSDTSYIYLFYIVSSIPFFFAGAGMALVFLAMSEKINKLYFADLIGAALATIILDPIMQSIGAGSVLLLTSVIVVGASTCSYYFFVLTRATKDRREEKTSYYRAQPSAEIEKKEVGVKPQNRLNLLSTITFSGLMILLIVNSTSSVNFFEIKPGVSKGLYYQLNHPSEFQHLSEEWNSFSRVDVTRKIGKQEEDKNILSSTIGTTSITASSKQNNNNNNNSSSSSSDNAADTDDAMPHELASIIIDADAATPIYRWDGSQSDVGWIQKYMDYLPYEMINANNTLVIGSGGGEDILVALSGGADNVTAVELNPLVVSAVKRFDSQSGNIYDTNNNVELFIDDGRRFISSTTEKYDVIVLKLVDSWAAQLAGGYALSENYLYTVEALQQYLGHLDKDNGGMLVMTRWNFELPRLMPLIVDSLVKETGKSRESVAKHVIVVEDRPGLYFGRSDDNQKYYPVLVMVKSTPFVNGEVTMVKEKAEGNQAEITMLADSYVAAPFNKLFNNDSTVYNEYFSTTMASNPTIPTDDSPFYFAREQIPKQMVILLVTVLTISGLLSSLLIYHARKTRARFDSGSSFHILFAIFIGVGFMILEVTFIQKFLLLLGTPIMALTVILFSILLSSGIGAYISGKMFSTRPHRAVLTSIPILAGIIILYFLYLQGVIASTISMELPYRIALTFGLLFPAGFLMGFQFPSLIKMASLVAIQNKNKGIFQYDNYRDSKNNNTTLLWGINIVASVIGTVLAAISAMIIGFNGNLLIGLCMYLGAGTCALFSIYHMMNNRTTVSIGGNL